MRENKKIKNLNKKGGERVLSLYWFVIFILLAIAVVSGVYIFFSKPIDVREAETSMLNDKVIQCFVDNGKLRNLEDISAENFEERCGLYLKDNAGKYDKVQYYIEVRDVLNNAVLAKFGDDTYKAFCGQEESKLNIPYCIKTRFGVLSGDNLKTIEIISAIGKIKQNAV